MFDNLFSPSPAVWTALAGGLIALPVLIHLINLMRHKRVEWAAMDFLLKSYRKNRNWVWLKQLLLLLSRIALLLLALLLLAQVGCNEDRIGRLLGGQTTHHYVLLDDSFSMSEQSSSGTAFDRALATLNLIGARAKNRENQKFSLLRYSLADSSPGTTNVERMDLNGELVDNLFDQRLQDVKSRIEVTALAPGPKPALQLVSELVEQQPNENAIVYVLSDFRQSDWRNVAAIDEHLTGLERSGAGIELINCASNQQVNLAVAELTPTGNVRVAGTPLMVRVGIKNCSNQVANKVQVQIESIKFDLPRSDAGPQELRAEIESLPTVFIDRIEPGKIEFREFPVYMNQVGTHAVRARLSEDPISVDNVRYEVIGFEPSARVLIIDDAAQRNADFLALALSPGGMTGIAPDVKTKEFLRDASVDAINVYDVIFLCNVDQLDESAARNLETFVQGGGGAGFFLGPETNESWFTQALYREQSGMFPLPLAEEIDIPEMLTEKVPDVAPLDHPLFPRGMNNAFLQLVQVKRIVAPPADWNSGDSTTVSIAANVRGNQDWPLIVHGQFGQGNVVVFTTTAGPFWNNWCRNGTFPPLMLLVENLLADGRYTQSETVTGQVVTMDTDVAEFSRDYTMVIPSGAVDGDPVETRIVAASKLELNSEDPGLYRLTLGGNRRLVSLGDTDLPGIYDVWLNRSDAGYEVRRSAINVNLQESDTQLANPQSILAQVTEAKPNFADWNQFDPEPDQQRGSTLARLFLCLLVGLLVTEQILAFICSFHAKPLSRDSVRFRREHGPISNPRHTPVESASAGKPS